jgi:hypothetical protein
MIVLQRESQRPIHGRNEMRRFTSRSFAAMRCGDEIQGGDCRSRNSVKF